MQSYSAPKFEKTGRDPLKFICFDLLSTFHYANKLRIRNPKKLRKRTLSKNCEAKAKRSRVHFVRSEANSLRFRNRANSHCEF